MTIDRQLLIEVRKAVAVLNIAERHYAEEAIERYRESCRKSNGPVPDRNKYWESEAVVARNKLKQIAESGRVVIQ